MTNTRALKHSRKTKRALKEEQEILRVRDAALKVAKLSSNASVEKQIQALEDYAAQLGETRQAILDIYGAYDGKDAATRLSVEISRALVEVARLRIEQAKPL